MQPTLTITTSGGDPLRCSAASVEINRDSWGWTWSATVLDRASVDLVAPSGGQYQSVVITINGHAWTGLAERWQDNKKFGVRGYTISGRSLAAELAEPHAAPRSRLEAQSMSAAQLASTELSATPWTLDWDILGWIDWTVPANTFSYAGLRPVEAVIQVARAVGAVVQADPSLRVLHVAARYPVSPWSWSAATPDAVLPEAAVTNWAGSYEPRPAYNTVYVSGKQTGVFAEVRRQGTAGDSPMPDTIIDPLLTDITANRERGRNELSGVGEIVQEQLTTVLMPPPLAPGVILPGRLLEATRDGTSWRGVVTGTRVQYQSGSVRQSLSVERHL
jgi:hypothetical protein